MLNMHALAEWVKFKADKVSDSSKDASNSRKFAAQNKPFNERLIEACRRVSDNPKSVPEELFIAAPERMLAKIAYMCLGTKRDSKLLDVPSEGVTDSMQKTLSLVNDEYNETGNKDIEFVNLESPSHVESVKHVLLCHGLSPIGDSILLLADIGRAYRVSVSLRKDIRVMLADKSWMSSNRSIRQFNTLSEHDIDTGLRVCLDKRERLYASLGIACDCHEIVSYDRAKKISGKKLEKISKRYLELAQLLWGKDSIGRLDIKKVKRILRPLDQLVQETSESDGAILSLRHFEGALTSLEKHLEPHLEILRAVAQQFNAFETDVFRYFFAQYYAQDGYRGAVVKVAPISEKRFDEPFDTLDKYFRAWGEGHSTSEVTAGYVHPAKAPPMSAVYFPQYRIGDMSVLPYTPLSLDALKLEAKDHRIVKESLIMLDDVVEISAAKVLKKNETLIAATSLVRKNRLVSDVASFVMLCVKVGRMKEIKDICAKLPCGNFNTVLNAFAPSIAAAYIHEIDGGSQADNICELWSTWLKNIPIQNNTNLIPFHLQFCLFEELDWTADRTKAASQLCYIAQAMHAHLTETTEKGDAAYLLKNEYSIDLPENMQREFSTIANSLKGAPHHKENGDELKELFYREYIDRMHPWELKAFEHKKLENDVSRCTAQMLCNGREVELVGEGKGPLEALVDGFRQANEAHFEVMDYHEDAMSKGEDAHAIAYIEVRHANGFALWGAAVDTDSARVCVKAILSALNRFCDKVPD